MFIDKYKYKNIVQYRKLFFKKIKLFLFYYIKIFKDDFILEKNY